MVKSASVLVLPVVVVGRADVVDVVVVVRVVEGMEDVGGADVVDVVMVLVVVAVEVVEVVVIGFEVVIFESGNSKSMTSTSTVVAGGSLSYES